MLLKEQSRGRNQDQIAHSIARVYPSNSGVFHGEVLFQAAQLRYIQTDKSTPNFTLVPKPTVAKSFRSEQVVLLQESLTKLIGDYDAAKWKSSRRKNFWKGHGGEEGLKNKIINCFNKPSHNPYLDLLNTLLDAEKALINEDNYSTKKNCMQSYSDHNKRGYSRLLNVIVCMQDEVLTHWMRDGAEPGHPVQLVEDLAHYFLRAKNSCNAILDDLFRVIQSEIPHLPRRHRKVSNEDSLEGILTATTSQIAEMLDSPNDLDYNFINQQLAVLTNNRQHLAGKIQTILDRACSWVNMLLAYEKKAFSGNPESSFDLKL